LEQREAVGDQDAAGRRRRIRDELVAAEGRAYGPSPDNPVRGQIVERHRTAALPHGLDDRARDLAPVDRGRTVTADPPDRLAELRQAQDVAGHEPGAAVLAVEPAALVGVAEDEVEDRMQVGLRARPLDAVARELD